MNPLTLIKNWSNKRHEPKFIELLQRHFKSEMSNKGITNARVTSISNLNYFKVNESDLVKFAIEANKRNRTGLSSQIIKKGAQEEIKEVKKESKLNSKIEFFYIEGKIHYTNNGDRQEIEYNLITDTKIETIIQSLNPKTKSFQY